jgi:hypothetical protein
MGHKLWRIFWWFQISKIQLPVCHQNKKSALAAPVVMLDTLLIIPSPKSSLLRFFWSYYIVDSDWSSIICGDHRLIVHNTVSRKQLMAHLLVVSNLKNTTSGLSSKQKIGFSATCGNFRQIVDNIVSRK